ncbi:hypothetical protein TNCV_4412811 [Trichonephila clavipes]|nr:hypothetical protein TNCV_4412811 [Trichonephila clavipes]
MHDNESRNYLISQVKKITPQLPPYALNFPTTPTATRNVSTEMKGPPKTVKTPGNVEGVRVSIKTGM